MADTTMDVYLQGSLTALGWIAYPFGLILWYAAIILLFLGKLLYGPLITFLRPFIYIGRFFLFVVLAPYHLFVQFEPLWNYLGTGAIIGVLIGLGLYYSSQQFDAVPDLNAYLDQYLPWSEGRTIKEYRKSKAKTTEINYTSLPSSGYASLSDGASQKQRARRALQANTILEEGDSDF